jgi:predicted transcriptional regulator
MRRRILSLVNQYPGLHLRELQRRAQTSAMLVEYHLNVLERLALVTSQEEGGYRRFFPARDAKVPLGKVEKVWLGLLRQPVPLGIALYLVENPLAPHKDLADIVPVTKSTLTYHLKNMEAAGLITREPPGVGRAFRLADVEKVLSLLRAYKPTPDLVAAYGDMWDQIFGALGSKPLEPDEP